MTEARIWALASCVALAACNRVFELSTTELVPDAISIATTTARTTISITA